MKIIPFLVILFVPIAAIAQVQWCNLNGECITQLKNHKLVNVPWPWAIEDIKLVKGDAKGVNKTPVEPDDCDRLGVSPAVCEKD